MLSLHPARFPSPSLYLSLIYIAMTPVSVMQAPCCEFHLSRKTSGDCYANGYVVGLVQELERRKKMVMFVSPCVRREAARAGRTREKWVQQEKEGMQKRRRIKREAKIKMQQMQTGWSDKMFYGGLSHLTALCVCMWDIQMLIVFALTDWIFLCLIHACLCLWYYWLMLTVYTQTHTHAQILPACSSQRGPNLPERQKAGKKKLLIK